MRYLPSPPHQRTPTHTDAHPYAKHNIAYTVHAHPQRVRDIASSASATPRGATNPSIVGTPSASSMRRSSPNAINASGSSPSSVGCGVWAIVCRGRALAAAPPPTRRLLARGEMPLLPAGEVGLPAPAPAPWPDMPAVLPLVGEAEGAPSPLPLPAVALPAVAVLALALAFDRPPRRGLRRPRPGLDLPRPPAGGAPLPDPPAPEAGGAWEVPLVDPEPPVVALDDEAFPPLPCNSGCMSCSCCWCCMPCNQHATSNAPSCQV